MGQEGRGQSSSRGGELWNSEAVRHLGSRFAGQWGSRTVGPWGNSVGGGGAECKRSRSARKPAFWVRGVHSQPSSASVGNDLYLLL